MIHIATIIRDNAAGIWGQTTIWQALLTHRKTDNYGVGYQARADHQLHCYNDESTDTCVP